jgi:hypothetical protein
VNCELETAIAKDRDAPPPDAVSMTDCPAAPDAATAVNPALAAPEATVTLAGTVTPA